MPHTRMTFRRKGEKRVVYHEDNEVSESQHCTIIVIRDIFLPYLLPCCIKQDGLSRAADLRRIGIDNSRRMQIQSMSNGCSSDNTNSNLSNHQLNILSNQPSNQHSTNQDSNQPLNQHSNMPSNQPSN